VSAYPYEIANLVDISQARIVWDRNYRRYASYGFLKVKMKIPTSTFSPVAVVMDCVNIYPSGEIERVITKKEYEYLVKYGADITIIEAVWLHVDKKTYPYRKVIEKLVQIKHQAKQAKNELDYHTVKTLMNSLYGKLCQLIEKKGYMYASACWNPIYASVITANTRIKVTVLQQLHPEIIAVHTDSVISTIPLDFAERGELGDMIYELEGYGVVIGSGLYQIGEKVKTRGFHLDNDLMTKIDTNKKIITIEDIRPHTWREVIFHNWELDRINRFEIEFKNISVNFDRKRLWIDDYKNFGEVKKRKVDSLPRVSTRFGV
jgi:predicted transcriptional regulator